jgi:hypothetical protein
MANQQSLRRLSREHLATAPSSRPKQQERLITHQPSVPQFSPRPTRRPRIQRTTLLGPRSRTSRNRKVCRRPSRTIDRKPAGQRRPSQILGLSPISLLSGRKLLRRASARSLSALLLLLRKRGLHRSNNSTRSPRRERRKRRSNRTKSPSETRSPRSRGTVLARTNHDVILWAS